MEGWEVGVDPDTPRDFMDYTVAAFPRSHALDGKEFKLPKAVLQKRWRLGCKRQGKIIPFETDQGLGQFDRWGHRLPDYVTLEGKVVVNRNLPLTPFLCLKPLASIYLVGGRVSGVEGEVVSRKRFWRKKENPTWLSYSQKCYLSGSVRALGKSYLTSPRLGISRRAL